MYKTLEEEDNQDIKHYIELVTGGLLYEYLEKEIKDELRVEYSNRKEVKRVIFTVLFTSNRFIGQPEARPKKVFKSRFPTVYKILADLKKGISSAIPILLQGI